MTFINLKVDNEMKALGLFVLALLFIISITIVIYHNIQQDTFASMGLAIIITSLIMYVILRKIKT